MFNSDLDQMKRENTAENINSEMLQAVRHGRCDTVSSLISTHGLSHCAAWADGFILLRDAIEHHHSDVARLLISSGAKINSENVVDTPLHLATINREVEIVRLLVEKGADVNARNAKDLTPLHYAVYHDHEIMINLLFSRVVNVNATDKLGNSLLHFAVLKENKKIANHLLKCGANVNCRTQLYPLTNFTPLHIASESGNVEIVQLLLDFHADANAKLEDGKTPLHIACDKGHVTIVQTLLELSADVNAKQEHGKTALHFACEYGDLDIIRALLESQADVNAKQQDGKTALFIASGRGHTDIVLALLESQADVTTKRRDGATALHFACGIGNADIVRALLECQVDVNAKRQDGKTALHLACVRGDADIIRALLESGAEFVVEEITGFVDRAAKKSSLMFATLLEYCVDVNDTPGLIQLARSKSAKEALGRHVWKLNVAHMFVPCEYRRLISFNVGNDFRYSCEEEVARMMSEKIEKTNIPFHDFLTKSRSAAVKVTRNADAMRELNSRYYIGKYPLYAGIIMKQIRSGVERNTRLDIGSQILLFLFPVLPLTCTENILCCLTNEELKMLTENWDS